jgi:hypothetical protein
MKSPFSLVSRILLPIVVGALSLSSAQAAVQLYEGTFHLVFPTDVSGPFTYQGVETFSGGWSFEFDDSLVDSSLTEQSIIVGLLSFYSDPSVLGITSLTSDNVEAEIILEGGVIKNFVIGMDIDGSGHNLITTVSQVVDDFVVGYNPDGSLHSAIIGVGSYSGVHGIFAGGDGALSGGYTVDGVPEPSSALLALTGVAALVGVRRRR